MTRNGRISTLARCFFDNPIPVPYVRQEGAGATRYANDCGPACVAMLLRFCGMETPTVDVLSGETALASRDNGLTSAQLAALGARHGLALTVRADLNLNAIQREIDSGRPVIMLINYGCIEARQNQADRAGHFVVVAGYDDANIIVNDPDWWGSRAAEGERLAVPRAQFERALQLAPAAYQGLVLASEWAVR